MIRLDRARSALACILVAFAAGALAAETVRPEVGHPLKAAEAYYKSGKHRQAMAKIEEADHVGHKTAYEEFLIEQLRGAVANASGDLHTAVRAFQKVLATGRLGAREKLAITEAVAVDYYKLKDYGKAAEWSQRYFKEGGKDAAIRTVELQSYYLAHNCKAVSSMLEPVAQGEAGRKPSEEELQILANCYLRQNDNAGYVSAIEKLVLHYPKKSYWTDLLARVQKKPGFSDRLSVHVYRLRFATGNFTTPADYMELAQLALQAGMPAEAKKVMDKGYAEGVLGKGAEAARQGRLRDLVARSLETWERERGKNEQQARALPDGDELVKLGFNYVYEGKADKGLALMREGIRKGTRRGEDAQLRLGEAELQAGRKAHAVKTLRGVRGKDGTADLARLWILQARS